MRTTTPGRRVAPAPRDARRRRPLVLGVIALILAAGVAAAVVLLTGQGQPSHEETPVAGDCPQLS